MTSPAALAFRLLAASAEAGARKETPIQKVTQLMDGMSVRGLDEKQKEQIQLATHEIFCDSTAASKNAAIKEADEKIEVQSSVYIKTSRRCVMV